MVEGGAPPRPFVNDDTGCRLPSPFVADPEPWPLLGIVRSASYCGLGSALAHGGQERLSTAGLGKPFAMRKVSEHNYWRDCERLKNGGCALFLFECGKRPASWTTVQSVPTPFSWCHYALTNSTEVGGIKHAQFRFNTTVA
jgi:hypothetical protein